MAGMGGDTMVQVLGNDWDKAAVLLALFTAYESSRCITRIGPQGWQLVNETGRQNRYFYSIIVAVPGTHLTCLLWNWMPGLSCCGKPVQLPKLIEHLRGNINGCIAVCCEQNQPRLSIVEGS